jgi:hypothetical protein
MATTKCGKRKGIVRPVRKSVGPGHGRAGRVITTPGTKTADLALLHDRIEPV